jgi:pyoverdine/dityrosine biosynthesis protein Dit1
MQRAPQYRQQLYDDYTPEGFDVSAAIARDSDIAMTYRGYIKFLEKDLEFTTLYETKTTHSQIKKRNEEVAKRMIGRGKVRIHSSVLPCLILSSY